LGIGALFGMVMGFDGQESIILSAQFDHGFA
jgi:hypothetical protein